MEILKVITLIIGFIGMIVISWGALTAFLEFLGLEHKRIRGTNICKKRELLRHHFGSYLLLGLEFMIAADIIYTIAKPNMEGLIILGSIVAIRTVISYFLNKEIEGRHNCQDKMK